MNLDLCLRRGWKDLSLLVPDPSATASVSAEGLATALRRAPSPKRPWPELTCGP
jgi:hypothetical protein